MINLDEEKDYYILVDRDGGHFGGYRIFESSEEVFEQFREWADADNMEDPSLKGWAFSDLIEVWDIDIKRYTGSEFFELTDSELDYKSEVIK